MISIKKVFVRLWNLIYNNNIILLVVREIKKLSRKRKKWLERRNKRKKTKSKIIKKRNRKKRKKLHKKYNLTKVRAPENFSVINNSKETIEYFNNIIDIMNSKKVNLKIFLDMMYIKNLTIDAIMYTIAIIKNYKYKNVFKYSFSGNCPREVNSRVLFNESGFFKYVNSSNSILSHNSRKIQIRSGNKVEPSCVKYICDFINISCGTKKIFTKNIYNMIIELMTNTVQHAYNSKKMLFFNSWYVFVEAQDDYIKIVFLDTGEGIPKTVRKKLREKVPFLKSDKKLIYSSLKGEQRTETNNSYRGKGLPSIADKFNGGCLENLVIFSGAGSCSIEDWDRNLYELNDLEDELFGTLFCWEINKNKIQEEFINDYN